MPTYAQGAHRWAGRIKALREKLGMNQTAFATAVGVGQNTVSRWEQGLNKPIPDQFVKMAGLAVDADKFYFLEEGGVPKEFFLGGLEKAMPGAMVEATAAVVGGAFNLPSGPAIYPVRSIAVAVLADAVAAGNPLTINEKDIDTVVPIPVDWLPPGSHVYGLRIEGDSMEPILHDKTMVLIDVTKRDLKKLNGEMVAVRVGEGVTVKYLRKAGKQYQLVPQNTSLRHEIRIVGETDDWGVVGKVVKIISDPPPVRK